MSTEVHITVGEIHKGKVLKIKPFGAIISLSQGTLGLVHISQIASGYINSVTDVLEVGDEVDVKVVSIDPDNKVSLSMRDVPQAFDMEYEEEEEYDEGGYYYHAPVNISPAQAAVFEEKFKSWQKLSNERIAGINRRNKRSKRR